eukprot:m.337413 g.337413  ORF g.337413 m.337413 type:complete len:70 (+) comp55719_c0_seq1:2200-2409(+)
MYCVGRPSLWFLRWSAQLCCVFLLPVAGVVSLFVCVSVCFFFVCCLPLSLSAPAASQTCFFSVLWHYSR